ncbi:P3H1 hydroxylase, partial [Polyodon spathula]|nr:P3H1 hydroxylase [Polyodon spathula]
DLLYDNAIEAYYTGDWKSVILNMERALRNKGALRRAKAHCCLLCANQTSFGEPLPGLGMALPGMGPVEDLGFFQKVVRRAACIHECEMEKVGPASLHKVSEEVALEFRKRSPYNYLQVAYFKINKLEKAVAAANTFYIANPEHEEMRQNLEYYKMMAGVQESNFKDLEAKPHMEEFRQGVKLYSDDQFQPAIEPFERALEAYFSADLECRAICEGAYDYDGYNYLEYSADLFQAITDHYIQVLNCKQNCAVELATRPGQDKPIEDFLPAHFNYLQFAYYNSEKYEKAIECAKTYLLFRPNDDVMIQNLAYYSAVLGEQRAATIAAREEYARVTCCLPGMYVSSDNDRFLFVSTSSPAVRFMTWSEGLYKCVSVAVTQPPLCRTERETAARISEEIGNLMKEIENLVEEKSKESNEITQLVREGGNVLFDGITVSMTSKELNGSQRAVLDGVGTEEECRELHHLSNAAALQGDGYRGTPSPHTPNEKFHGVTLAQEGKVPLKSARLYHDLSEKVRKVLESYFRLETPLYFSYTHLVCRSAIDEKQEGREDLSHSVHVDNCLLNSEAMECIKETPAYTYRDYSAILYLNDDFEGGNFIFTELDAKTVTAEVRPKCGRVVGFGAGKENPHGVRAVTKGQRCAVAIWFTLDPRHNEKERIQAEELLKMLSSPVDAEFQGVAKESPAESKQTAETPGNAQTDVKEETDSISEKQAPVTEVQTDSESGLVSDSSTINASVSSAETEQKVSESRDPTATTSSALDSRDRKEEL